MAEPTVSDRLIESLLQFWQVLRRASHPVRRAETTAEQYWLLRLLYRTGPRGIGELAEALGVTGSSVTTACKRLEKAGLVRRERQASDERVVRVSLTQAGRARVASWQEQRRAALAQLLAPLTLAEQAELQRLIARVLAGVEVGTPVGAVAGKREITGDNAC